MNARDMMRATRVIAALLCSGAMTVGLGACSSPTSGTGASSSAPAFSPVDITSCGEVLHFDQAPQRVVMLNEINAPILHELGVLDHVVAKAGSKRVADEDPALREALDSLPRMEGEVSSGGGISVTDESVLSVNADLVITFSPKSRESLAAVGIPVYVPAGMCPAPDQTHASWEWVDKEIDTMATIFGVTDRADALKASVADELDALEPRGNQATAAAVYITPGVTTVWTYGTISMVQPMFEANGLSNIYADQPKRVFEVSVEDLLAKDPQWIVVLTLDSTDEEALAAFRSFPGIEGLNALQTGRVVHIPYAMTDPASTLTVDGASLLGKGLASHG